MPKPRVFVSSVVEGFQEYREAARSGIEAAGGHPVLVNEDFPALPKSSRNACLDGVESSDVLVCIIGQRGGWTTPNGKLVVEEEYDHANQRGIPTLIILVDGPRDPEAHQLVDKLSDYVHGRFRLQVSGAGELHAALVESLEPILETLDLPMTPDAKIAEALTRRGPNSQETFLRMVLAPERMDEVIDPLQLDERSFIDSLYALGHRPSVQLLDYRSPKDERLDQDRLIIEQGVREQQRDGSSVVRIELDPSSLALLDANVTGRTRDAARSLASLVVIASDIGEVAGRCFAFYRDLLEMLDKHQRYDGLLCNAALLGLEYRTIVDVPPGGGAQPMRMAFDDHPIVAFDQPRRLTRATLREPGDEVGRIVGMLRRRAR